MSYQTGKKSYTEVAKRAIYILHTCDSPYFYIGHCRRDLIKSVYNAHLRGEYYKTCKFISELKAKGLRPCLHILEEITATKVMAYRHVIAWTRILDDAKYETLDEGKVLDYIGNLFGYTQTVFETNKHVNFPSMFICDTCVVKDSKQTRCPLYCPAESDCSNLNPITTKYPTA